PDQQQRAAKADRDDQNSAESAPMPGLRMMPRMRPDVAKAMALVAALPPRSPAIALPVPSIPPLAAPVTLLARTTADAHRSAIRFVWLFTVCFIFEVHHEKFQIECFSFEIIRNRLIHFLYT